MNQHPTPLKLALAELDTEVENWQLIAMARGLLRGYDARWREAQQDIVVQQIEATYESPLFNPETGRRSQTFSIAGKIDKLAEHDGRVLYDHKTTQSDISDPNATYWRQLNIDAQAKHYELLLWANGIRVDRIVWDVVRKPGIRPKKLTKIELAEICSLGSYCGFDLTTNAIEVAQATGQENAELYEMRVAVETINKPDRYFQRRGVPRTRDELAEYAAELWNIAADIREARRHNRWYRNSGACMNYGTPCQFLGICSGHDTEDSDNWIRKGQVHAELDLQSDGRSALTHSRLRCFQTCRRKHFYQYELGLARVDEEQREALYFGSEFHQALDVWWSASTGPDLSQE